MKIQALVCMVQKIQQVQKSVTYVHIHTHTHTHTNIKAKSNMPHQWA